jgi:hypothetical protein
MATRVFVSGGAANAKKVAPINSSTDEIWKM